MCFLFGFENLLRCPPTGRILDAGCGMGYFLLRASRYFKEVYGIDRSEFAIENVKNIVPRAHVFVGSVEKHEFNDDFFDCITAFDLVEHLKEPEIFIKEVYRVLKPGGIFVFSTPNPESLGATTKVDNWYAKRDSTHCSILDIDQWRKKIKDDGFLIVDDGTDTLWDTPYVKWIPRKIQWLLLISSSWILIWWKGYFHWKSGENYYCIAKKVKG